ncbi:hypothetical protein ACC685_37620, partial [Rhizobium ruizarguesonis]
NIPPQTAVVRMVWPRSGCAMRRAAARFQNLIAKAIIDGLGFGVTDLSFTLRDIEESEQQISIPLCIQLRLTFDGDMVLIEMVMK